MDADADADADADTDDDAVEKAVHRLIVTFLEWFILIDRRRRRTEQLTKSGRDEEVEEEKVNVEQVEEKRVEEDQESRSKQVSAEEVEGTKEGRVAPSDGCLDVEVKNTFEDLDLRTQDTSKGRIEDDHNILKTESLAQQKDDSSCDTVEEAEIKDGLSNGCLFKSVDPEPKLTLKLPPKEQLNLKEVHHPPMSPLPPPPPTPPTELGEYDTSNLRLPFPPSSPSSPLPPPPPPLDGQDFCDDPFLQLPFYFNICPILQGVFFERVFEHLI